MRTYIFVGTEKVNGQLQKYVAGMRQCDYYPSGMTSDPDSKFYAMQCIEVTEDCHIRLGVLANL